MPLTFSNSARLKVGAHLRQQFANALSKDLVNDAAGSSVDAPDSSSLASNMIEKNDAISEYSQPIGTVKFSFERSDVSFFLLQSLQAAPQRLARLRRQRTNEIDDLLLQFNLVRLIENICWIIFSPAFAGATEGFHRLRIGHNLEGFNNGLHPLSRD